MDETHRFSLESPTARVRLSVCDNYLAKIDRPDARRPDLRSAPRYAPYAVALAPSTCVLSRS